MEALVLLRYLGPHGALLGMWAGNLHHKRQHCIMLVCGPSVTGLHSVAWQYWS